MENSLRGHRASYSTGGRLKRLKKWIGKDQTFLFTYEDGVADVDIKKLIKYHRLHKKLGTVTSGRSPERFGRIVFEKNRVTELTEKSQSGKE